MFERVEQASPARLRLVIAVVVTPVMLGLITHGNYAASGDAVASNSQRRRHSTLEHELCAGIGGTLDSSDRDLCQCARRNI